jgi:hypothetical protein
MRRLLMRGLRAGRQVALAIGARAGGAIAKRKNIGIARGLQRGQDDQLVIGRGLKPADIAKYGRALHAGGPDDELSWDDIAIGQHHAIGAHFSHAAAGQDLNAKIFQQFHSRSGDAFGQGGQDARCRFNQADADIACRVNPVQAIGDNGAQGAVQFGGEFRAGSPRTDDRNMKLAGAHRFGLAIGAQARIHQPAMKPAGLRHVFQRHGVFRRTWCAEIIGDAADADHQRVIGHAARRRDLAAFIVEGGADQDLTRLPVNAGHGPEAVGEVMVMRLAQIMKLMPVPIEAAGRHRMQQRLPQMGAGALHQRDLSLAVPGITVTKPSDEFQPGRPTADDNDPMWRLGRFAWGHANRSGIWRQYRRVEE